MATAENKAVIRSFIEEVINQGQLDRINDLVALDFVELDPLPGQQQGREGLKQVITAFRTAFPDIQWVIEEMVGEEDKVFSRFTWRGTHRGEFFGVPATGRPITVKGMVVDRVVGGNMVDSRILMDTLGMMTQLGVIPAEKAATWPKREVEQVRPGSLRRRQGAFRKGLDPLLSSLRPFAGHQPIRHY